jgi:hypothetical protein
MRKGEIRAQSRVKYFWCLHCEKAWSADQFGLDNDDCPDKECDGRGWHWDIWNWADLRRNHPEYPTVPVPGSYYST